MTNSVEPTPGGSTAEAFDPPTPEEVAARLLGTDKPAPPEPPPGTTAERPAEPSVVITEPTRTASEPAPPPRPSAETTRTPEVSAAKPDLWQSEKARVEKIVRDEKAKPNPRSTQAMEAYLDRIDEEIAKAAEPTSKSTERESAKDKATEAKLEKAEEALHWKSEKARVQKVIEQGKKDGKSTQAMEAYLDRIDEKIVETAEVEEVKPESSKRELSTEDKEKVLHSARNSVEMTRDVVERHPLVEGAKLYGDKPGEVRYDPDIVQWHLSYMKAQENLAEHDESQPISLSYLQIDAITNYLKDEKAQARQSGDEKRLAEIDRDLKGLKSYRTKYMRAVINEPITEEEIEEAHKNGREFLDIPRDLKPYEPKTKKPPVEPIPDPPIDPIPNPPIDPIPDPPINPIPGPPNEPPVEPRPIEPIPPTPDISEAQAAYDAATEKWAAARIRSERLLSRGEDKENLAREKENMDRAFEAYCTALSQKHVENITTGVENTRLSQDYVGQSESIQRTLDHQRSLAVADRDAKYRGYTDAQFAAEIQEQVDYRAEQVEYQRQSNAQIRAEVAKFNQVKAEELMKVRARVDAEMLRQRTEKHPRLAKINEWLKTHKKTRMIAGLALTAIGVTGTITGLAPLAVIGFGGRTALGAFGAYNAARGIGETVGDSKRFGVGENNKANIDAELGVQEKQTTARRWSKRAGAAAAAIVGAIGAYKLVNAIDGPPPRPDADHRYGSINNGELNDRLTNGDFVSGAERTEAIARLKGVIGEDLYNRLGQEQREALLLLKNEQIDQAPEYFAHLTAGHFG